MRNQVRSSLFPRTHVQHAPFRILA